jgi:hypothetical protein
MSALMRSGWSTLDARVLEKSKLDLNADLHKVRIVHSEHIYHRTFGACNLEKGDFVHCESHQISEEVIKGCVAHVHTIVTAGILNLDAIAGACCSNH